MFYLLETTGTDTGAATYPTTTSAAANDAVTNDVTLEQRIDLLRGDHQQTLVCN